jgi:hypothetical protein
MYLTDLCIRNVGPMIACDVRPQFRSNGDPKPLLFVGENGAGKTLLLSSIADALVQMASPIFSDVSKPEGIARPMFRVCGSTNQRTGSPFSVTLLRFASEESVSQYVERTGELPAEVENELVRRFPAVAGQSKSQDLFHKDVAGFSSDLIEGLFLKNAYCFFPASRREPPHWQNMEAFPDVDVFSPTTRFKGRLGKQVIVTSSTRDTLKWILDVVLDSRIDVRVDGEEIRAVQEGPLLQNHLLFGRARNNIEAILKKILQNPHARLVVGYRGQGSRLQVDVGNGTVIPSLSHLSLGQSVLFNLFCTIVRHAETEDLNKGHQLDQVSGIAIIDEIESHLHEVLRYEVLPELIAMFPKVQFIVATHSPSVLLGLDARLGTDGFTIIDLPGGIEITTERFSEFRKSVEHLRNTTEFESAVLRHVRERVGRPTILTEGDTDPVYIRCALEVLGRAELLKYVDVDWVGAYDPSGKACHSGASALNAAAKLFQANPNLLRGRLMLLYDCDTNRDQENIGELLWVRRLPMNGSNTVLNKGIENLLPADAATAGDYDEQTRSKDYGGSSTTRELNKRRLCDRICRERDPSHFIGFGVIVKLIDEFIGDSVKECCVSTCFGRGAAVRGGTFTSSTSSQMLR